MSLLLMVKACADCGDDIEVVGEYKDFAECEVAYQQDEGRGYCAVYYALDLVTKACKKRDDWPTK